MPLSKTVSQRALATLALAILFLSFTPILFRWSEIGPTASAFYRAFLTIPVFWVWAAVEGRRGTETGLARTRFRRSDMALTAFAGAVFAANISAYAWAVHLTSVANASLLSNLAPIFVSLASFLLFGERVSRGFIAAMIAAIVGVTILVGDKLGIDRGQILGDGLGVFSSLAFAGYLMAIGRLRLRQRSSTVMAASVVVTALCLLLQALATGERLLPRTIYGWADLLALALVSHALGQGLLTVALAHVSATFSAVSLLTLPVTAAFYGWLAFGEPLTVNQAIGAPIVLTSILAARLAILPSGR
ncbi:MAG TPA: DMT family transporter [Stellaceae bacterium]|nr:DMT family transporter [Stellaceae bacterium]